MQKQKVKQRREKRDKAGQCVTLPDAASGSCRDTVRSSGAQTSLEGVQGENVPLSSPQRGEWRGDLSSPFTSIPHFSLWHFMQVQKWRDQWVKDKAPTKRQRRMQSKESEKAHKVCVQYSPDLARFRSTVPCHGVSSPTVMWGLTILLRR